MPTYQYVAVSQPTYVQPSAPVAVQRPVSTTILPPAVGGGPTAMVSNPLAPPSGAIGGRMNGTVMHQPIAVQRPVSTTPLPPAVGRGPTAMVSNPLAPPSGAIGGRPFIPGASPVYTQPMYNVPAQARPVSMTSVPVNMPGVSSPSSFSTGRTIYSLDSINAQLASSANQPSNSQAFDLMTSIKQQQAQCVSLPPSVAPL